MEKTNESPDPSPDKQAQSFKQNYAGTFVSKRIENQNTSTDQNTDKKNAEWEPIPMELKTALDWVIKNHEAVVALCAIAVVGLTLIYAFVTGLQWYAMRESNQNTRDAFETEASAQIAVTNIQWRVNQAQAMGRICADDGVKEHICFRLDFINGGKTAATDTLTTVHILPPKDIPAAQELIEKHFKLPPFGEPQGRLPVSTGPLHNWDQSSIEEICESRNCILRTEANSMIEGEKALYIYGAIQYWDIFKRQHATRFCFVRPPVKTCTYPAGGCMNPCPFGNWVDKEGDTKN
jgi:hypothetical protein